MTSNFQIAYTIVDIDGCITQPCWGGCQDVPYTDPLIVLNPGTAGDDYICDPCPHGMQGSAVGRDGCTGETLLFIYGITMNIPTVCDIIIVSLCVSC